MGIKVVQVITDSFDGKELDSETKPIRVQVGRKAWSLYLSDTNAGKFYDQLEKWTKNEPEESATAFTANRTSTKSTSTQRDPAYVKKVREWLQAQDWQHKDKPLADRGRIPQEGYDLYDSQH